MSERSKRRALERHQIAGLLHARVEPFERGKVINPK